jgi:Bax protein
MAFHPNISRFMSFAALLGSIALSSCQEKAPQKVKTVDVVVTSIDDITPVDSLVVPYLYSNVLGLDTVSRELAKEKFISVMVPAILVARQEREADQVRLARLLEDESWNSGDSAEYHYLCRRYKVNNLSHGLIRMQTYPTSMILAQAAVETGWGSSRFFTQARNVFGIWSFSETDQRVEAHAVRGDQKVYLRAYHDLSGSVRDYLDVLSHSNAFRGLRIIRQETEDPFTLIPYLRNYSERKGAYTKLLKKVIEQNDLTRYDRYQLHPDYLIEE